MERVGIHLQLFVRVGLAIAASGAGGCIELFAEPPDLGTLTLIDGLVGAPSDALMADQTAHDAETTVDMRPATDAALPPDMCGLNVETCDAVDNDCDRIIDEGEGPALCGPLLTNQESAEPACLGGICTLQCYTGRHDLDGRYANGCEYVCVPFNPPATDASEECNGQDDDCDGRLDESNDLEPTLATNQTGVCAGALRICTGANWREPHLDEIPGGELIETQCDALDNDCDGHVDEALVAPPALNQRGVCAGSLQICDGHWREPSSEEIEGHETEETRCDGADSDCDGEVDERLDCDPGCDAVDNDGDGRSDEGCVEVRCAGAGGGGPSVPPCNGCPPETTISYGWVCIPSGEFMMGSLDGEIGRFPNEGPRWPVPITRPFLMKATEVTQREWQMVFGIAPWLPCEPDEPDAADLCPARAITWFEAIAYTNELSRIEDLEPCYVLEGCDERTPGLGMTCASPVLVDGCTGYRLATEAEWEYATRAGSVTRFWFGDDGAGLMDVGWHEANSNDTPHITGRLSPNPWGLHDVHGNVAEWVADSYDLYLNPAPRDAVNDPIRAAEGGLHIVRGGSYWFQPDMVRSARRDSMNPEVRFPWIGVRPVRTVEQ